MEKKHMKWIDAVKGVAILAVVLDHSFGILYTNRLFWMSTYFSVSVFIFMSGITSYYSCERYKNLSIGKQIIRRIGNIFIPYAVATCIYQIRIDKIWDLHDYVGYLLKFNITPPFYFVVFFLQLIIISPYLYRILHIELKSKWKTEIIHGIVLMVSVVIAIFSVRYTFVIDVYGGGKYILGGELSDIILHGTNGGVL